MAADDEPGAPATVVLGHGLWKRRFEGALDIVGRTLQVNGRPRTVVGVMPPSLRLPLDYRADRPSELWFPIVIDRANLGQWGSRSYFGIARLAPWVGASTASSEAEADQRSLDTRTASRRGGRSRSRLGIHGWACPFYCTGILFGLARTTAQPADDTKRQKLYLKRQARYLAIADLRRPAPSLCRLKSSHRDPSPG